MILIDTSVWIDHLRGEEQALVALLNSSEVLIHPFVIGELACGNLRNRAELLDLLNHLPCASVTSQSETLFFIEQNELMGKGLGFIDMHLLAATALAHSVQLWTRDKQLARAAVGLNLVYSG